MTADMIVILKYFSKDLKDETDKRRRNLQQRRCQKVRQEEKRNGRSMPQRRRLRIMCETKDGHIQDLK